MTRRTLATLTITALAAAACTGPLPSDGTTVQTRQLTVDAGAAVDATPPITPILKMTIGEPSSMFVGNPSVISLIVSNATGPAVPANNVKLTIALTGSLTVGALAGGPGGAWLCTVDTSVPGTTTVTCQTAQLQFGARFAIPVTATAEGTISSLITLTSDNAIVPPPDSRQIVVTKATTDDLAINGSAEGSVFVGSTAGAAFTATNAGPLTATGVRMTLTLSGPGTFAFVSGGGTTAPVPCSFTATSATCTSDSLSPRTSLGAKIGFTATGPGTISIFGSITGNETDSNLSNNNWPTFTTAVQPKYVDLTVAAQVGKQVVVSHPLNLTITAGNKGPDTASSATLYDVLPPGMTFVSATPSQGTCDDAQWGVLSCDVGPLAAGKKATVAVVLTPTAPATVTNDVTINDWTFGDFEQDYSNNEADNTFAVHGSTNQILNGPPTKGGCGLWSGAPLDNLEDGNPLLTQGSKTIGSWFVTSDGTGYQFPTSLSGLVVPGGPSPSKYMVSSTGDGLTDWGAALGIGFGCSYDVSRFHALRFDVKAGGQGTFFVEVATDELLGVENGGHCTAGPGCYDYYRLQLSLPDDGWYTCTVAFTDLQQAGWGIQVPFDVGAVTGAQFNIEAWQAPYDLSLDNLEWVAPPRTKTGCVPIGG
jgi:uncharacterized repeat protein (TIGR01451 family)